MVHGPLAASNLLVTWRRHHGGAKITWQLAEITRKKKTLNGGHGEVQSFVPHAEGADNICLRERENQAGMKGGKRCRDVFKSLPFFLDSAENILASPSGSDVVAC